MIGAGAAGLVTARELLREGHDVIVFEQTKSVGGVWVYDPEIEGDDLLGLSQDRKRVHSSMYASLRTNLPREIMGYTDFPFLPRDGRDGRRFPGHAEVAAYLQDFAEFYHLLDCVQFSTSVDYVGSCKDQNKISWKVRTRRRHQTDDVKEEQFDAVVVCNGHYSQPKLAEFPGIPFFLINPHLLEVLFCVYNFLQVIQFWFVPSLMHRDIIVASVFLFKCRFEQLAGCTDA